MRNKSQSRRTFLKRGASALAGVTILPTIIPASALGKNGSVAPSNRIEMALVGCGGMGRGNMRRLLQKKEVQLVALCDVDKRHLKLANDDIIKIRGNSDAAYFEDFRDLLETTKLDASILALPDHWHSIIGVSVANKGIHIYGEKPLARSIVEGRAIVDAVEKNKVTWQTGSWQRSQNHFYRAVELVRNGVIGKVTNVEVGLPDGRNVIGTPPIQTPPEEINWDMWLGPAPTVPYRGVLHFHWRWMMDYSGGQLTDWAGHHVDIAHWGLGYDNVSPIQVEGKGVYPVEGIYDVPMEYDINCIYESGVQLRIANKSKYQNRKGKGTDKANKRPGMGVVWYGDKGWIHVDRNGLWASDQKILDTPSKELSTKVYQSTDHWGNFLDCIKSGEETITPVQVAHNSISVGLLGEIAMLTGETLQWDRKSEQFLNSERANRLLSRPYRAPWSIPQI